MDLFGGPMCINLPNFVSIAWIWSFFDCLKWRPSWILKKVPNFTYRSDREGQCASPCQILCWSVELLRRYGRFSILQDGGRPPSWICFTCIWTIHEEHLLVFVTVQNLRSFDNMPVLMFWEFGLKMLIHASFGFFVGFDPLDGVQYQPVSQRLNLWVIAVLAVYNWCWYL